RDVEIIDLELILSDLEIMSKRLSKTEKLVKTDKSLSKELKIIQRIVESLEEGIPIRMLDFDKEDEAFVKGLNLLSKKPVLYAANISEEDIINKNENEHLLKLKDHAKKEGSGIITICGKIESEIAELEDDEKEMFLEELGIEQSGLDRLIKASYELLGLISFLTAGPKESRAWTIKKGSKAPEAAGKIHTDMEKGFIRAEIVSFKDLNETASMIKAKEQGLVRLEGKEYIMQDGDVVIFRFNV
ncbi:MAG: DUF933 domain-containing protein, partial [Senegalia sp. (in: firmicutes)]